MTAHGRATLDAEGWVESTVVAEAPPVGRPPGIRCTPADAATAGAAPVAHLGAGRLTMPQDDRIAWRVLRGRGLDGARAAQLLPRVRTARRQCRADLPPDLLAPIPSPPPECVLIAEHAYPEAPGLRLRAATCLDLDAMAAVAVETGLYAASCPDGECEPPEAHAWVGLAGRIDHPHTWQLVLEFEGRPLQVELITHTGSEAVFRFTAHLTRERPHWFWREAEAPVFGSLRARGVERLTSTTRRDRPDWIAALEQNYGATRVGETALNTILAYPLAPDRFTGWPARRPVPTATVGAFTLREGSEADFSRLDAWLGTELGAGRAEIAQRIMREWYVLDRASLLVAERAGELVSARCFRHRRDRTAGYALLANARRLGGDHAPLSAAVKAWARAAGYDRFTTFIPEAIAEHPAMRAALDAEGGVVIATHRQFREPFVEVEVVL